METSIPSQHFVWIKVVKSCISKALVADAGSTVKPTTISFELPAMAAGMQAMTGEIHAHWADVPPKSAYADGSNPWLIDRDFDGVRSSGLTTDYMPMQGSRWNCWVWLLGADGQKWVSDAETYFLLSVKPTP